MNNLVTQSRELYPENSQWMQLAAGVAQQRGETGRAVSLLEQAVEIEATPQRIASLVELYLETDRPRSAEALINNHPELLNTSPTMQALRGSTLAALDDEQGATRVFHLALERATAPGEVGLIVSRAVESIGLDTVIASVADSVSGEKSAWVELTLLPRLAADQRQEEALSRIRNLSEVENEAIATRLKQFEALFNQQLGRYQEARDIYRQVLEAQPDNVEVLNNLAYLLAKNLNQAQAAVPLAERAAGILPENAEILDTLGLAQLNAGQTANARTTLERSVQIKPLPINTLHLAQVYMELELAGRASQQLRRSIELAREAGEQDIQNQAQSLLDSLSQ
jgi:tetratricopeptide (TPR) repeat protein